MRMATEGPASIRAGYSKRTAKEMAHENLTKPHIVAAIQKVVEARSERTEVTQDRVVEELAHLAFASIGDVVEWDGSKVTIKASEDLPDEVLHAISEVGESFNKDGDRSVKVKQYDKLRALDMLGKHVGLFKDGVSINIDNRKLTLVEWFEQRRVESQAEPST